VGDSISGTNQGLGEIPWDDSILKILGKVGYGFVGASRGETRDTEHREALDMVIPVVPVAGGTGIAFGPEKKSDVVLGFREKVIPHPEGVSGGGCVELSVHT